ncbi:uncharacterized protein N7525_003046 [Penicillium rubens]|uniref:uncharacterized protein n=1 Tax=Penicillium rubens TaxID=1108849 RepID=UPI002A59E3C0|nr:uncharacterized protein N7525_003046 [Penicillium rubens]KAJ5837858.1 hypothetical protein N7525_003046 [Penicillium rubens]KAJ5865901.1 hypothetical protein N7534_000454 [Penicillium rubens]
MKQELVDVTAFKRGSIVVGHYLGATSGLADYRIHDPNALGERDIDRAYDWSPNIGKYDVPASY